MSKVTAKYCRSLFQDTVYFTGEIMGHPWRQSLHYRVARYAAALGYI